MGIATAVAETERIPEPLADIDPERFYETGMANPVWQNGYTGEQFCWHARFPMATFRQAYMVTRDLAWLDAGLRYFERLVGRLETGPDGYKGWIGPYIYDNSVWVDVHVGDAILFDELLAFSELVLIDQPELEKRFGEPAREFVALARKHLFEKWDSRGTWFEDGPFGSYRSWNQYGDPGDLENWTRRDSIRNSDLTLPLNKNLDMASVALRIHRITGEDQYLEKARKILLFVKSRMQRHDGAYVWNYWEPFGKWDLDGSQEGGVRHWVGVHPYRNYQAGEVSKIVDAFHRGVVFTVEDIESIIKTNLEVMWNGDRENPVFANSNLKVDPGQQREREDSGRGLAGTLWGSLADFSAVVREIQMADADEPVGDRARVERAYRARVVLADPPSWDRRYMKGAVSIPGSARVFPMGDAAAIRMAVVIPKVIDREEGSVILGKLNRESPIEVALYDADGEERLGLIFMGTVGGGTGGREGIFHLRFRGNHPATNERLPPGNYRVRWTVPGDGQREFPVTIPENP